MEVPKVSRIAAIESLPIEMQDHALVDWKTVALITGYRDVETARETVIKAGVPLVNLTGRRTQPRWGALREFLKSREKAPATAA